MTETNSNGISEAIGAGRALAMAATRVVDVTASVRGVDVKVPFAFTSAGDPKILLDAVNIAVAEADRVSPTRRGKYAFDDLDSIIAWANRFKTPQTCAYLLAPSAITSGSLTIVVDDLDARDKLGTNRNLRASLPLALHERLKVWIASQGDWIAADAFCTFIEMAGEELSSADLITMTQNLEVKSASSWKRVIDDKGTVRVQTDDQSGPATRIPREFGFVVPAFEFTDKATAFKAQLFSKIEKGQPCFMFRIVDLKRTISEAMTGIAAIVKTALPAEQVYFGTSP